MDADVVTVLTERESLIARLRRAYGFSELEAIDFLDQLGGDGVDKPVDLIHVEQAA